MVRSECLTADELVAVIGMEPDQRWSKGEPRSARHPDIINKATAIWFKSDLPSNVAMTEKLTNLLSRVQPVADRIGQFSKNLMRARGPDACSDPWVNLKVLPWFRIVDDHLRLASHQVDLLSQIGADFEVTYVWDMPGVKGNGTSGYGVSRSRYDVSLLVANEFPTGQKGDEADMAETAAFQLDETVIILRSELPPETPLEQQLDELITQEEPQTDRIFVRCKEPGARALLKVGISSWQDEYDDYLGIKPQHFEFLAHIGAAVEISFAWDQEAWKLE
jgi:hypothetical protein